MPDTESMWTTTKPLAEQSAAVILQKIHYLAAKDRWNSDDCEYDTKLNAAWHAAMKREREAVAS